jgi:tetratricopeptide (TPR) repeat protein
VTRPVAVVALALAVCGCLGGNGYTPIRTFFNRGVYQYSRGNYESAIAEYRDSLSEDPTDHRSRFNLALSLEARAAELDGAPGRSERARSLRAEAERAYVEILRDRPRDIRATVNLSAMEVERGERDTAYARLRDAIREHPGTALPRAALAAHLLREGDREEARRLLLEAREREPADSMTNALLGETALALGNLGEAREAFETVLERDPSDPGALLALGRIAERQGDRGRALDHYRRAALAEPGSREAHLRLAELYAADESTLEEAVRHLWQARRIGGDPAGDRDRLLDLYRRLIARER